ncbi:MAG: DUF5320 domain-containing protein [Bacteroidales bacterium]|nr:DUF5320 domain-containing protein [Bacteroidales bacterium]
MPRGDRTGPDGMGPMTGRRMGYCVGNDRPGYMNPNSYYGRGYGWGHGRGFGYGRGMGYGFRGGYGPYYSESEPPVSDQTLIENEIRILKDRLASLEKLRSKDEEA